MINTVVLTGRLTRDVDLRYTQGGTAVGTFNLAVDRRFTNANGDREADFVNCVIWRKSAENLANFVHKGSLLGVEGRIQTRNYENKQGQRVYVTEVVVENFTLLEPRQGGAQGNSNNGSQAPQQNPFGTPNNQNNQPNTGTSSSSNDNPAADPFAGSGDQIDISDDDLPF
ncbi:Single-stranded DNA-binding protein [Fructilactobacillus florum 8D]|uniref:Single-stranded DNA-binding protein n=2 Tax=Fructilactobacillus florum TaxID=640331 RepID=W9ELJ4_9LACO|nr:single-stranded DNA-binding protein [Fructilactobacillus florum]EKK20991.1 Single-stranded DNA-binding protein [Fructilactobacillus florum 2F]ETO40544.1 Single-stranded DNA-binding protein [Fructilactobacillus florum 8D]